ncbi:MAG TPA: PDZ domain-containing protein [Patescibacteria group bacterium]|nr:PDZ domain-containing protein [Patescibacteria group bacterium]
MSSTMKWVKVLAVVLIATLPLLFAGGDDCKDKDAKASAAHAGYHGKCTMNTQDCLDHMAAKMKNSGWVGIEMDQDETTGALTILKVVPGSPAESAGLQPGDLLFALNGVEINDKNEEALSKARKDWKPGQTVNYTVKRGGGSKDISLTLAPMPADVLARFVGEHMLEHASTAVAAK